MPRLLKRSEIYSKKRKCSLFIWRVILLYRDIHEKFCSQIWVSTRMKRHSHLNWQIYITFCNASMNVFVRVSWDLRIHNSWYNDGQMDTAPTCQTNWWSLDSQMVITNRFHTLTTPHHSEINPGTIHGWALPTPITVSRETTSQAGYRFTVGSGQCACAHSCTVPGWSKYLGSQDTLMWERGGTVCLCPSMYCPRMVRVFRELCPGIAQLMFHLKNNLT